MKNLLRWTAALSLGLAFAGCGGGNGGIVTPTPTPTSTTPPILFNTPIKLPDIGALTALNNQNQILSRSASGSGSVFLGSPTLTPQTLQAYQSSTATASGFAASSVIIGQVIQGGVGKALFWANPTASPQLLAGSDGISQANAINDSGGIVGWGTKNQQQVALYWSNPPAQPVVLTTSSGEQSTAALAINSNDSIVGTSSLGTTPLYWLSPISSSQRMTRLAAQTGIIERMGINTNGNVFLVDVNSVSAFYSSPTATPIRLTFLPGASNSWNGPTIGASSMNASGVVVGTSPDSSGKLRAVRWVNGAVQDLNSFLPSNSGWVLQRATYINDSGAIVGTGTYNGSAASFYVSPQ